MQFRMSKSEIDHYFDDKHIKGSQHFYHVGERSIHYVEAGDTTLPLVIFVHGSPGSLDNFIHFLADSVLLSVSHMITVDRPGFGSSNFGWAEPSLKKQSAILKPLIDKAGDQHTVILVGHSLGGPVIARMAMDFPEKIKGIIMVAPSIDPELEPKEWFRAPLATPFLRWLLPRSLRASNDEIYHLKPELQAMVADWKELRAPTLVIQGDQDKLVPKENAAFAKRMIVNASIEIQLYENVNHFIPWNNSHLIRNGILKMLSEKETAHK